MLIDLSAEREVYVVFQGDTQYRFSRFLKPGFLHVFCIERMSLGWLCMDPSRSDMISTILPATYAADIMPIFKLNNPSATVLKLVVKPTHNNTYPRLGLISCVSAVQYFLGVYWPFIFTPYQLWRKLSTIDQEHIRIQTDG